MSNGEELLGHADVSTMMIYTHTRSPATSGSCEVHWTHSEVALLAHSQQSCAGVFPAECRSFASFLRVLRVFRGERFSVRSDRLDLEQYLRLDQPGHDREHRGGAVITEVL